MYRKDISESCYKRRLRTYENKIIAMNDRIIIIIIIKIIIIIITKQKNKTEQVQKKTQKEIHEKSTAPGSIRRSPIQILTGLALLNFIEKTRVLQFHPIRTAM